MPWGSKLMLVTSVDVEFFFQKHNWKTSMFVQ